MNKLPPYDLRPDAAPFDLIGGAPAVHVIAQTFYDVMEQTEPALAAVHACDPDGKVSKGSRERFEQFLVEWLGGPAVYSPQHGHPRLRMRHARVPMNAGTREAWLGCMQHALNTAKVEGSVRAFLDQRFADVATFLISP
jgi:hemoglobin